MLVHGLGDEISEPQLRAIFEHISYLEVITLELFSNLIYEELNLRVRLEIGHEDIICSCLRDRDGARKGMVAHVSLCLPNGRVCLLEA